MLNIEPQYTGKAAFLHLGFRPFFFAPLSFSVVSISLWLLIYTFGKGAGMMARADRRHG
ncbi:MAG: hypothetical protein V3U71_06005 [Cocleimonas sp.]